MSVFDNITAMMVDDCIHDPVLGAKIIIGIKDITEFQELRLRSMWTSRMFIDSSGFGTGKTLCLALVAALRSVLFKDRISGVIAGSLRQGTLIHAYFDRWIETSRIFREQVRRRGGVLANQHHRDSHILTFKNGSEIRTLAPDFRGGAKLIASESWSDGYFDEWVRYSNPHAFNRVLLPRTRRPVLDYDCTNPIFDNHCAFFGTADYQWNWAYSLVSNYTAYRDGRLPPPEGTRRWDYDHQSWSYKDYGPKYRYLVNMPVIRTMEISNPKVVVEMEIYGHWVKDSAGFYSLQDVRSARTEDVKVLSL